MHGEEKFVPWTKKNKGPAWSAAEVVMEKRQGGGVKLPVIDGSPRLETLPC